MTNRQHLGFFMPSIKVGGVERTLLNILTELANRDFRLTVLTSQLPDKFKSQLPENVEIQLIGSITATPFFLKPFSAKSRTSLNAMWGLAKFLKQEQPDALYSFQGSTVAVVARFLVKSKTQLFVRESNTPSQSFIHDGYIARKAKIRLKRTLYKKANTVISVSEGVADDLVQSVKIPRAKIKVIYNPTFTPQLIEMAVEPLEHKWLNTTAKVPVIISVGRLSKQKDHLTLIDAFALVRKTQDARLIIVGEGPERMALERRANELEISADIDLVGEHSNPYKYLSRANLFVLSSIFEGLPNAVIEAVACGLPVVATDCPSGPREILLNGAAGTLVPVGNPERMAEAILAYLNDPALAELHVQAGNDSLARFTPQRAADSYLSLIDEFKH